MGLITLGLEEELERVEKLLADAYASGMHSISQFDEYVQSLRDVGAREGEARVLSEGAVQIMTVHASKGLEYGVVFIAGCEENLFPHWKSLEESAGIEEERRLMYVGLTRAMERLYLSYAFRRSRFGDSEPKLPSRFLAATSAGVSFSNVKSSRPANAG